MNKYGDVAVAATHIAQTGVCPVEAWNTAAEKEFKDNATSIKKGCPKNAFLGLAESGFVVGVPKGSYTKSVLNKQYALEAVRLLNENPSMKNNIKKLWVQSCGSESKVHNSQMDVVVSLWSLGLLE
ncbi:TPA: hypothetical protein ACPJ0G_004764 [Vibrio alginolyticus]|uniref:DUF6979 family protein n=1 Tax=Vibrio alginolyticus TaxID=663 RepID=UPI001A1CBED7|nr:hypothetical protein [Vibrio alginolyticus]EGQ7650473.1 hypothetical protein [Vibrio alginolyticus]MBS9990832.1 hypothetical protein [Vibrio alginolyticus]MBT0078191.1 hypothetical protein [Vibrio alginolyticus]